MPGRFALKLQAVAGCKNCQVCELEQLLVRERCCLESLVTFCCGESNHGLFVCDVDNQ
jgi:hypothetical protein